MYGLNMLSNYVGERRNIEDPRYASVAVSLWHFNKESDMWIEVYIDFMYNCNINDVYDVC